MAIDTEEKRRSAIFPLLPWLRIFPTADSDVDQGDRQHVSGFYAGILAGDAPVPPTPAPGPSDARSYAQVFHAAYDATLQALRMKAGGAGQVTTARLSGSQILLRVYNSTSQAFNCVRI